MFIKGEIPFVRLLIPLIAGITLAYFYHSEWLENASLYALFVSFGTLLLLLLFYKHKSIYRNRWIIGCIVHAFLLSVGCYLTSEKSQHYSANLFTDFKADALAVKIMNEPKASGNIVRFESEVSNVVENNINHPSTGKLLVALQIDSTAKVNLQYGDVLLVPANYTGIDPPFNPGEFDYKGYLANHQLYHQIFISHNRYKIIAHDQGNSLIACALNLRKNMVKKYYQYLSDKDAAAFASTLILGYRADLSPEVISAYSKTGTMHVLSVSGMHVGIVFIVLAFFLKPLNRNRGLRIARAVIIISVIWFYSLLTGFSPSVCRAAVMLTFIVLGKALNKSQNSYNLLAISAFCLLLYNPFYLMDVGFQLSYLAVLGLVYFHPKIYHSLNFNNKILDAVWSYTALSLAAQLATFPLSVYYFHQFPIYFLFSNLFIVIPAAIIMYAGILFLFLPWDALLTPLGKFLNALINFTNYGLIYFENLPWSNWEKLWITFSEYFLLYLIIGFITWALLYKSKKALTASLLSLMLFCTSISYRQLANESRNELVFYSLRKNYAIAYNHNGRSVVYSDAGEQDKIWQYSIRPAMDQSGSQIQKVCSATDNLIFADAIADSNYMQFGNFKVLRWDRSFNKLKFDKRIKSDAVLISGNPWININKLMKNVDFKTLLIDGTNPDYKIKQWEAEALNLHVDFHVLKKNPAYIVKL